MSWARVCRRDVLSSGSSRDQQGGWHMQAMVATQWGEPKDMQLTELPDPEPGPGEVAIDVRASGCNFFDILMVQGKYQLRPPLPFSPGGEIAGVVRAVGA